MHNFFYHFNSNFVIESIIQRMRFGHLAFMNKEFARIIKNSELYKVYKTAKNDKVCKTVNTSNARNNISFLLYLVLF